MKIVNLIAQGELGKPLNRKKLFRFECVEYEPETCNHAVIKIAGCVINLYPSGKFVIFGAKTKTQLNEVEMELKLKL